MAEPDDPRTLALDHVVRATRPARSASHVTARQFGEAIEAVVWALVYVGDQLAQPPTQPTTPPGFSVV